MAYNINDEAFRLLVESVVDYAIFMLDPKGRVTSWNPGAERIKGYRDEEIRGRHYSCFYPEEARRAGTPAHLLEVAASQGPFVMRTSVAFREMSSGTRRADVRAQVLPALNSPTGG